MRKKGHRKGRRKEERREEVAPRSILRTRTKCIVTVAEERHVTRRRSNAKIVYRKEGHNKEHSKDDHEKESREDGCHKERSTGTTVGCASAAAPAANVDWMRLVVNMAWYCSPSVDLMRPVVNMTWYRRNSPGKLYIGTLVRTSSL